MDLQEFLTPAITCPPEVSLAEAAAQMDSHGVGSVIVVDSAGQTVGILTDRDIAVRAVAKGRQPSTTVAEVMTRNVVSLREDADLFDAVRQLASSGCRRLPVVGATGALKGVVTLDDLMCLFAHQTDSLASIIAAESAVR